MRPLLRCGIATLAQVIAVSHALAQEPERLVTVVRVSTVADRALLERVRGQTTDLDVDLVVVDSPRMESRLADQIHTADALARSHDARVVVWFETTPENVIVHVSEPRSGRVLVRLVGEEEAESEREGERAGERARAASLAERDTVPTSAVLEAAAIVLRTALRALAAGAIIGVARAEAIAADAPTPPSAPAPGETASTSEEEPRQPQPRAQPDRPEARATVHTRAEAAPGPIRARETARSPWLPFVSIGWQAAVDGESPVGAQGVAARLGVARGAIDGGLVVGASVPAALDDDLATVRLSRHSLAAFGGVRLARAADFRFALGVQLGMALFLRSTTSADPRLEPATSRVTPSLLAGSELRMHWMPGGHSGFALVLGADLVPGAPIIGYRVDAAFEPQYRLWVVQPRASLGIVVLL